MKYAIKKIHIYEDGTEKVLTTESFESGKELFSKYTLPQLTGDIFFSHVEREDGHKLTKEELQKLFWNFGIEEIIMKLKRPAHTVKVPAWQGNWIILHDDVRENVWVKIKGTQKHVIRRFWDEDFDYSSWEVWISDDVTNSAWGIMEESDPKYIKEI